MNLRSNNIDIVGIAKLSDALKFNKAIRFLNLSYNPIKDGGMFYISKMIEVNKSIEKLILW